MKAESNAMPMEPFSLDVRGDWADVIFFTDLKEVEKEEGTAWEYETYMLTVPNRPGLAEIVAGDLESWRGQAEIVAGDLESWRGQAKALEGATQKPRTLEERVTETESKVVSLEEVIDLVFGG